LLVVQGIINEERRQVAAFWSHARHWSNNLSKERQHMLLTKNKTLRQLEGLLETFNPLFLRLLLRNPSKVREFPGKIFREYMSLVEKDKWICKEILELLPAIEEPGRIVIEYSPREGSATPLHELAYLALITKVTKPKHIFEIGTFRGRTALNFAQNSPEDCVIWTLDLLPDEREAFLHKTNPVDGNIIRHSYTGIDYKGKVEEHKIRQLYGNSLTFDFSPYFGDVDMVFVDGAHHYEVAKSDTVNALKMVKPNGLIIWHDFANYGDYNDVTRAVLDTLSGDDIVQIATTQLALYLRSSKKSLS